ncbi:hypothetical protein B0W48_13895 [Pseudoalteromonas aliena]|jgi:hypothetical protein|uniref:Uncharacterized protein n=1 Tax=Pseudoalteromonas aliena TaxID=247523 RepID=A0A1Q2H0C6_9GAMM|nr:MULTISPECIES: hypothetical protein [Pseudoalteromonas]AQQ00806.1 hypothetical protein B0W48_13895 [Pseudoalteromonas aliena]
MTNITQVNPQVVNALEVIQQRTLSGEVNKLSGAGKAYQSVSQSSAIAIQDATDNLRNINTMATTAMGVAMAQMLATGDVTKYNPIIDAANAMVVNGADNFKTVGTNAGALLNQFPTGAVLPSSSNS